VSAAKDLTLQKFGRLTALYRDESVMGRKTKWWCVCDCQAMKPDNEKKLISVFTYNLTNGTTKSCGCLQKEKTSDVMSKPNRYKLDGEFGVGYTSTPDSYGRYEFYFDLEDYDKIKDYTWSFSNDYLRDTKDRSVAMHQIILPTEDGFTPEHIHGSKTKNDNRKFNLRIATQGQNLMNTKPRTDNTSGVKGVYWRNDTNKWSAGIWVNKKHISLGCYDKFEDAVNARKMAEEKYFGEFSYYKSQII
jgi:hypothetical protein